MNTPEINDGGPAFPTPDSYDSQTQKTFRTQGMSLRDWFAGQALMGMYAGRVGVLKTGKDYLESDAEVAYDVSDAMLKQRNKK